MKVKSLVFEKMAIFYSLHMKSKQLISKNEKYFNFSKMDKKNVQNWVVKILLTDRIFL